MSESHDIILIGVDGGGSGCRIVLADSDLNIIATTEGGRANAATEFELALRNIRSAIEEAGNLAGLTKEHLYGASVHLGLAGVTSEVTADRVAADLPFTSIKVTDDRPTSVAGALGGKDGFLVSVGTGTIIASRQNGQNQYVGGWGFYVADQASGAWLGRRLLEQTLLCHDRISAHGDLTRACLAQFENDPNQIVSFSVTAMPGDYARLAPMVVSAAEAGDLHGRTLMQQGADYLTDGLNALQFDRAHQICLTGGVGPHYQRFLPAAFTQNVIAAAETPVMGAVRLAAELVPKTSKVTL